MEIIQWFPWYLFLILVSYVFHRLTGCFSKINIFTVFLASFLLNHGIFIPANVHINDQLNDFMLPDIVMIRWMSSLILMYIFFIVGILLSHKKTSNAIKKYSDFTRKNSLSLLFSPNRPSLLFGVVAILLSAFTLISLWQPQLIIQTLAGGLTGDDYRASRVSYGEQFSSQDSIISRAASTIKTALIPMFTYVYFVSKNRSNTAKLIFLLVLATNLLLGLMSGQKAGLSQAILGLAVANILMHGNGSIKGKNILILLSIVIGLIFVIWPLQVSIQYPNLDYLEILEFLQYRISGESVRTLQLHFYVYPDKFPHLMGLSSSLISGMFGITEILDPGRVVRSYIAFGTTTDATGIWNTAFLGTAWADFGYIGVAIESALVTMLLSFYHRWYLMSTQDPIVVGTYVSLALSSMNVAESNLSTSLFTGGLGLTFLFVRIFVTPLSLKEQRK
jgi:oligosaccharide repeat unit polymerase